MSLPGWLYFDAEFFEAEKRAFLRAAPQVVCHESEIAQAGEWRTIEYLGESVIVIRGDDGECRAFSNVCRHRGSRIVDGTGGCARVLTCPYHAWSYARDGRLVGVPHREEYPGLDVEAHGLFPVALERWRGFLFVRLEPSPVHPELSSTDVPRTPVRPELSSMDVPRTPVRPELSSTDVPRTPVRPELVEGLALSSAAQGEGQSFDKLRTNGFPSVAEMMAPYEDEVAPYRFEELRAIGRVTLRERPLNWKTIADNYSDHLHIPVGHPGLTRLFGKNYRIEAKEWVDRMEGDLVEKASANASERAYQKLLPEAEYLPASHRRKWLYYKLFPNVAFDIYPDQVDFMQFLPVSSTETVIREISYALPDGRREMRAARYLNWRINRRVNAEDTELITRVQKGMESPAYVAGPLGTSEVCLRSFASKLRRMIPEARLPTPPAVGWSAAS